MSEQNTQLTTQPKYMKPQNASQILEELKSQLTEHVRRKSEELYKLIEKYVHEIPRVNKIHDTYTLIVERRDSYDLKTVLMIVRELDDFIKSIELESNVIYYLGQKDRIMLYGTIPPTSSYLVTVKRSEQDDNYVAKLVVQYLWLKDIVVYDIALLELNIADFWS